MCTWSKGRCSARARPQPGAAAAAAALPLEGRLYRNDLQVDADGTRTLRFTDVTDASGIDARGYGMGVAAGDFDNDGWVDLYLTNFGPQPDVPQQLRRHVHRRLDARAARTTRAGACRRRSWISTATAGSTCSSGNYLTYSVDDAHHLLRASPALPDYCPPERYRAAADRLYRNRGDGTFADVTASAGLAREFGPALGVATADFNGDGWIDIFVANDGRRTSCGSTSATARSGTPRCCRAPRSSADGEREASMGVDAGDFDNDGDEDLFMTELTGQGSTLYVNDGTGIVRGPERALGPRRPSCRTPASAPPGSTSTTTAGWTS